MNGYPRNLGIDGQRTLVDAIMKLRMKPQPNEELARDRCNKFLETGLFGSVVQLAERKLGSGTHSVFKDVDILGIEQKRQKENERQEAKAKYAEDNDWSPLLKTIARKQRPSVVSPLAVGITVTPVSPQNGPREASMSQELFPAQGRLNFTHGTQSLCETPDKSSQRSAASGPYSADRSPLILQIPTIPCAQPMPPPVTQSSTGSSTSGSGPLFASDHSDDVGSAPSQREKRAASKEPQSATKKKPKVDMMDKGVQMPSQVSATL